MGFRSPVLYRAGLPVRKSPSVRGRFADHREWSIGLLVLGVLVAAMSAWTMPAQAAACSASAATVTQTSSPIFYIDDPSYDYGYASYQVTTGASGSFTDLWVKVDSFTNTSLLGPAESEDGLYHVGALSTSSSTNVYFLLKGAITASAQSYTMHLYNGKPSVGGTETCSSAQSNSSVATTIQSSNNAVSSVSYTAPYLGSGFTMTVIGDTGTIGAAGIFSYTPASQSTWNADCLELSGTSITMSGGNTGTFTNGLYRSSLSSSTTHYTITYSFNAKCVTASSTAVVPLSYISSGAQVKHTSVTNYGTLPPIQPAVNALVMTKTVSPAASVSGGTATYSLKVTNNGPNAATLDDFADTLPSSPASVSYTNSSSTYDNDTSDGVAASTISNPNISGQTLTWTKAFSIPSGKTAQLSFQATIPSTTGSYVNSAVAHSGSSQIDQTVDTTNNTPATATYGVGDPSMAASTKTASDINGGTLQPSDIIEYTITAQDTGSNDATNVHISDTIDTSTNNLSNVVIGANGTDCGNGYTNSSTSTVLDITGATVAHGSTCVVTFRATVKSSTAAGTTILNSASIVPGNVGGISGSPASTPMIVHKDPILSVTNTENDSDNIVIANQVVTYTTTITNSGQSDASGVNLTGTISGPVGSLSSRTLTNCGPSTTYVDTSALPAISIAALAVSTSTPCVVSYTVTVNNGATSGSVTNSADVSAAREGGNDPDAVSASTLLIGVTATPPSLATGVTENDPDGYVNPGQTVTYTATITNSGQTDAGTSLAASIPTGLGTPSNIQYTNCGSPGSSYGSGILSITSLSVAAAGTCTITFTAVVNSPLNEGTTLVAGVDVAQASQGGNNPANVNAPTLTVDATPILAITSAENDADDTVSANQDVTYTITVTNTGDGAASGVPLTEAFTGPVGSPSNFSFTGCGSSYTNNSTTSVNVTGLAVAVGTPCVITFHEVVNSNASGGATIIDSANVSSATEGGNNPIPVSASVLTVGASPPSLSVSVADNDTDNTVTPAQTVQFTVTVTNSGGVSASTQVAVAIPTGLDTPSSINFSNCGSASSGYSAPTLTLSSLAVGTSTACTVTFNAAVSTPNVEGRTLIVTADATQASEGGNDPSVASSNTLTVDTTPALSVTNTENDADNTVTANQDITYTVTITNSGDGDASGISLSDTLSGPVGNPGSFGLSNCGSSYSNGSTSSVSISGLAVTTSVACMITFHVTVNSNATGGASITSSADVSAAMEDSNNPAAVPASTLTVATVPNLAIAVADNDTDNIVTPGQTLGLTVTLSNTGNGTGNTSGTITVPASVGTPSSIGFSNCGSTGSSYSAPTLTLSSLTVSTSASCVITFNVAVNSPGTEGATFSLAADIAAASEGGNDPSVTSSSIFTINTTPNLSTSTKTVTDNNGGTVEPGDTLTYALMLINTGDGNATGVSATDTISSNTQNLTNVIRTNCGSSTNGSTSTQLSITGITVAVSTNCVITFDVTVKSPLNENTAISNTATISAASEGGSGATPSSSTLHTDATPHLIVTHSENDTDNVVSPNQSVTYTIDIQNTGNGQGSGIAASSTVSSNATLTTGSFNYTNCGSPGSTSTSSILALNSITVTADDTCTITYTVVIKGSATDGATVASSVDVSAATEGGNNPAAVAASTLTVSLNAAPDGLHFLDGSTNLGCSGLTANRSLRLAWDTTGATSYEVSLDGGPAISTGTNIYYDWAMPAVDGAHTFAVRSIDSLSNASAWSTSCSVTLDQTAPTVNAGADHTTHSTFTQTDSSASDTNGIASYGWTKVSGPGTVTLTTSSDLHPQITVGTDGTYILQLTATDNAGNSTTDTFMLIWEAPAPPPSDPTEPTPDNDGAPDIIEQAAPNNGDANSDGQPDAGQKSVTSFVNTLTDTYTVLENSTGCQNTNVSLQAMGDLSKADNHYTYPAGLVNFTLTCTSPGATTRVSQFFYGIDAAHLVARKYDSRTRTYETIPNAEITTVTIAGRQAVKISYDITDGGPLDEDGTVNGVIVDPSGPAMLQNSVGSPDTGFRSQPLWIPILGWIVGLGVTVSSVLSFSVIKCRDR